MVARPVRPKATGASGAIDTNGYNIAIHGSSQALFFVSHCLFRIFCAKLVTVLLPCFPVILAAPDRCPRLWIGRIIFAEPVPGSSPGFHPDI